MLGAHDGIHMVVDKPFIYRRGQGDGLILAAGHVAGPPNKKAA
jgi:hypothetical protein